jgi:hypothetical protein
LAAGRYVVPGMNHRAESSPAIGCSCEEDGEPESDPAARRPRLQ